MQKKFAFSRGKRRILAQTCPCGKSNNDGKFAPDKYDPNTGYCHSCCRAFFGKNDRTSFDSKLYKLPEVPSFHSRETVDTTLKNYGNNNLILFCKKLFPKKDVERHAQTYGVGTSSKLGGKSTVFWQQDRINNVRAGKIIKYDSTTGKRLKYPQVTTDAIWVHSFLETQNFNLQQCLFGLHLITSDMDKDIAIVESEKTAFIMSLVDDSVIYLATGGKSNFNLNMLRPLKGRTVTAYPDNGEFELWKSTADSLRQHGLVIQVSQIMESPEKDKGWDLADEVIRAVFKGNTP